ncbi:glycosyl hydrolase 53 family protein [Novipirellula artificiosorum]|uniref:Arabinogalactan endo-beta-1,4-galactanase n=1 Tax=Novipirellula artificiosorum TaxID=2528016 RepID=A0A5C6DR24_9BACT|nr:glycosyl hydrolase 53 family protein [Novipirellula artificiosorum]TWU38327.1 Arabinogalactan endo-1,4-beta-galactosidase precursor [Novipirellula artificiosorum]
MIFFVDQEFLMDMAPLPVVARVLQPFMICLFSVLLAVVSPTVAYAAEPDRDTFLFGGDISALTVIEKAGGVFQSHGKADDAIRVLADNGANCFRLRLFVNPLGENVVVNDLPYTLELAKRIKATNAKIMLDFHYSDTWADPGHQNKPAAWAELDLDALEQQVFDHFVLVK